MVIWESDQWLGNNIVWSNGKEELQESMVKCAGRNNITEIILKAGFKTTDNPCIVKS